AIAFQQLCCGLGHFAHSEFVHRRTVLVDVVHLLVDGLVRRRIQAAAALQVETHTARSVDLIHCVDKPYLALFGRLQQHRTAAVAEEHAGGAVGVVGHACIRICADHQNFFCAPLSTIFTPASSAYTNPEQPPETSNPHAPVAPILFCTRQAVEGNIMSGVTVPTMIISTSLAAMPRMARHFFAASAQMSLTPSPLANTCRSRMPVRSTIHSSLVSTNFSRS